MWKRFENVWFLDGKKGILKEKKTYRAKHSRGGGILGERAREG